MRTKQTRPHDRTVQRLREIERIIKHRHGIVPYTDDADLVLDQVVCCFLHMMWKRTGCRPELGALADRLKLWCELWAPEIPMVLCRKMAEEVLRRPRLDDADVCAKRLRLSYEERTLLRITTIGAYDADKTERQKRYKMRKRARDRERAARKRAERGAIPRAKYRAASLSNTEPWKELGISRRTWERHRARRPNASNRCKPRVASPSLRTDASPSPSNRLQC